MTSESRAISPCPDHSLGVVRAVGCDDDDDDDDEGNKKWNWR